MISLLYYFLWLFVAGHPIAPTEQKLPTSFEVKDFSRLFSDCGVRGSFVLYDVGQQKWTLSDTSSVFVESLPASTFKICNLLIGLETGKISSLSDTFRWRGQMDTVRYGYRPEIYKDLTVREAFRQSAVWGFLELAEKIGAKNYQHYLEKWHYGNNKIQSFDDDFWNFGSFGISPFDQVKFLKHMQEGTLERKSEHVAMLYEVMLSEQHSDYTIRSKTGWTRDQGINTGWWVGMLETKKGNYLFATRLLQDRKNKRDDFGECRKSITKTIFSTLGLIEMNNSK